MLPGQDWAVYPKYIQKNQKNEFWFSLLYLKYV